MIDFDQTVPLSPEEIALVQEYRKLEHHYHFLKKAQDLCSHSGNIGEINHDNEDFYKCYDCGKVWSEDEK